MGCYKTHLRVTVKVLAEASGRCEETVRRHIKDGRLSPWDLESICGWMLKYKKGSG